MCNACNRNFSTGREFGPAWYGPKMIMESVGMYCRGMSRRQISGHWRDTRRSEDEGYPSHAIISKWAMDYATAISKYTAQFAPGVSDMWSTDKLRILVDKVMRCLYVFMCHGARRMLGAGMGQTRRSADMTPIARGAKTAAGKVSGAVLGTAHQA